MTNTSHMAPLGISPKFWLKISQILSEIYEGNFPLDGKVKSSHTGALLRNNCIWSLAWWYLNFSPPDRHTLLYNQWIFVSLLSDICECVCLYVCILVCVCIKVTKSNFSVLQCFLFFSIRQHGEVWWFFVWILISDKQRNSNGFWPFYLDEGESGLVFVLILLCLN